MARESGCKTLVGALICELCEHATKELPPRLEKLLTIRTENRGQAVWGRTIWNYAKEAAFHDLFVGFDIDGVKRTKLVITILIGCEDAGVVAVNRIGFGTIFQDDIIERLKLEISNVIREADDLLKAQTCS